MKQHKLFSLRFLMIMICIVSLSACSVYSFRDVSIDYSKIKTIKISYIENKARYINPQLSSRLTDGLTQKVSSETKLTRVSGDNADYQVSGTITNYDVSTAGVANNQVSQNKLSVGAHITFVDAVDNKTQEFDISHDFTFASTLTLTQAEAQSGFLDDMVTSLANDIFNKVFSNW